MSLTFNAERHEYHDSNGVLVPNVTSVISCLSDFSRVPPGVLLAASEFGRAVHLACELDDANELDEETLDPALVPYLAAWRKFSAEHKVKWELREAIVHNATMGYCGTLDCFGTVDQDLALVDIKSSVQLYPSTGPQLAAYEHALPDGLIVTRRLAVQLKGDGNYVMKAYDDPSDWPVFASLLTLKSWCNRYQITPTF